MLVNIEYPWPTPSLNQTRRLHWGTRKRQKTHWSNVTNAILLNDYPNLTYNDGDPAIVTITRYSSRSLDHDNLVGGAKFLVDLLKEYNLIVDDTPHWVEVIYQQAPSSRADARTLVEVQSSTREAILEIRKSNEQAVREAKGGK